MIDRLTMWVAETGVAHYRRLAELGSRSRSASTSPAASLRSPDFPDRLAALLERMSAPPGAIGLEITESVAMHDPGRHGGGADAAAAEGISESRSTISAPAIHR